MASVDFDRLQAEGEKMGGMEGTLFAQYLKEHGQVPPSSPQIALFVKVAASVFRRMLEDYHQQLVASLAPPPDANH